MPPQLISRLLLLLTLLPWTLSADAEEPRQPSDTRCIPLEASLPTEEWLTQTLHSENWQQGRALHFSPSHFLLCELPIKNPASEPRSVVVRFQVRNVESIELAFVDQRGELHSIPAERLRLPDETRQSRLGEASFSLTVRAHSEGRLLWLLDGQPPLGVSVSYSSPEQYLQDTRGELMLFGLIYGALLALALYTAFLYVSVRAPSMAFYVCYVLTSAFVVATEEGHMAQFFPNFLEHYGIWLYWPAYAGSMALFTAFTCTFLNLNTQQPRVFKALVVIGGFSFITSLLSPIMQLPVLQQMGAAASFILYFGSLLAAVRLRLKGSVSAGHYVFATLLLVLAWCASSLSLLGLLPVTTLTHMMLPGGLTIMLIFFALAQADRINLLKEEKARAQDSVFQANEEKLKVEQALGQSRNDQERLEDEVASLRRESQSKSDFLSTLGHEIRTPLSSLVGMVDLLQKTDLDEHQQLYLKNLRSSGSILGGIINDVLDYALIETGRTELTLAEFNLDRLVDECIGLFTTQAHEKEITLITEIDANVPRRLRGDAGKLRQILVNLLSNACKFSKKGDVILSISRTSKAAVNGVELRFAVRDNGIGLNEAQQRRLFSPFADNDGQGFKGTGLGLAICRHLVQLMDGRIGVDSQPGSGSTFWFTARLLMRDSQEREQSPLEGHRLLLAMTPGALRQSIEQSLNHWGIDFHEASDVAGITSVFQKGLAQQPEVILLDQQLDGLDGLEIAREFNRSDLPSKPAIILLWSSDALDQLEGWQEQGVSRILEKPLAQTQLYNTLHALLKGSEEEQQELIPRAQFSELEVIVAEDNLVNQMVIRSTLQDFGIEPQLVTDGQQLLDLLRQRQQPADLILMDCEMPVLDGFEASLELRLLEQERHWHAQHVVALSAHESASHRDQAQSAGMNAYLTKPLDRTALADLLAQIARQRVQRD